MRHLNKVPPVKNVKVGGITIGDGNFTVIAGPCSIESAVQFDSTVNAVSKSGAALIRGGIWKLRTSPKSFQGLGAESFDFVKEIIKKNNVTLVSEITDIAQIEQIDDFVGMYQVGARNMHNYSLLKELGKQKKPVLLKRGFAALVDEWIKAADYVVAGGNDNVILCERGIRTFETSTRNTLDLNAVVYAKHNCSFPVFVDPSHAVGISALVADIAIASAASGADGIMVEVHDHPAEALSDGQQALTYAQFDTMMFKIEKVLNALDRQLVKPNLSLSPSSAKMNSL